MFFHLCSDPRRGEWIDWMKDWKPRRLIKAFRHAIHCEGCKPFRTLMFFSGFCFYRTAIFPKKIIYFPRNNLGLPMIFFITTKKVFRDFPVTPSYLLYISELCVTARLFSCHIAVTRQCMRDRSVTERKYSCHT